MAAHHNARTGHKVAMAALFACLTAAPAMAQSVPLPTPRPASNTTGSIVPRAGNSTTAKPAVPSAALGARAQAPNPISNPFAALLGKSGSASTLNPEQRAIIDRVNNYLSSMQALSGNFVQVGPDGGRTQGRFYISKPGKVRFEYNDPSSIELIADGQSVVVQIGRAHV